MPNWRERFASRIIKAPSGCWIWTGKLDRGYGRFWLDGRTLNSHRVAWELANGPVPDGLVIDHLCRVRRCVNPLHMEPVTTAVNVLRGQGITAINARRARCINGHVLTPDNVYMRSDTGARNCIPCQRARVTAWRAAS